MSSRVPLGRIVRLQVQPESLKQEIDGKKIYQPDRLLSVDALTLTPTGATTGAADGSEILDVHNTRHPRSKHWGANLLSLGFTAHYAAMTQRFGNHVTLGGAGENLIVETAAPVTLEQLVGGVTIETPQGLVRLTDIVVAAPCQPFSTFALGDTAASTSAQKAALQFLHHGMRGYYCRLEGVTHAVVRVGAPVFLG